jgi:hypothetical protein
MLISYLCDVGFTHPTKMRVTVSALHMVTTLNLLDRCHAAGTASKLLSSVCRPLFKVHSFAFPACMPLLTTLETHFLGAVCAHCSVFTATWLFYGRVTVRSGTPLHLFVFRNFKVVFCNLKVFNYFTEHHYCFFWDLQIE